MRRSSTRRAGAFLLLVVFLTGCTESVPTSPLLVPEGPEETRLERAEDEEGRSHTVRIDTRGGYIMRVEHVVDGQPFAQLVYHYRAAAGGTYALARVTGRITAQGGRSVDLGSVWPQVEAAAAARGMADLMPAPAGARIPRRGGCRYALGELFFLSGALAYVLIVGPFSGPSLYIAIAGYIHAMHEYDECSGGTY